MLVTRLSEPKPVETQGDLGLAAEDLAARHLSAAGLTVLARRFRTRTGEIDLIADEAGVLVFVEVKARTSLAYGRPSEAVGARKQGRMLQAARVYLSRAGNSDRACRFDVVEILYVSGGRPRLHHIRDAFQPG